MINTCPACGQYRVDKQIPGQQAVAICPQCGYAQNFRRLPLLLIGGASGAGKSAVLSALIRQPSPAVLMDADILWQEAFDTPQDNYRTFHETWLRLAKNIGQNGRPVAIFGAGLAVPQNVEPCVERRYFADSHYLALVCDGAELRRRLLARPAWRKSGDEPFVQRQLDFNRWLRQKGPGQSPPVALLDTTAATVDQSAAGVAAWIAEKSVEASARPASGAGG